MRHLKYFSLVGAAGLFSAGVLAIDPNAEVLFQNFMQKYGKHYSTSSEKAQRLTNFIQNLEKYEIHNSQNHKFKMGVNKFSDLTETEFKNLYTMPTAHKKIEKRADGKLPYPEEEMQFPCPTSFRPRETENGIPAPFDTHLDWRYADSSLNPKGRVAVSAVKDQGSCGSCYAFSAVASFESALCYNGMAECSLDSEHSVSLSEQQVLDCGTYKPEPGQHDRLWHDYYGCNGGWQSNVFQHIYMTQGLTDSKTRPYLSGTSPSLFPNNKYGIDACPYEPDTRNAWMQDNAQALVMRDICGTTSKNSNTDVEYIKKAIYEKGPISMNFYVESSFSAMKEGIYQPVEDDCINLLETGINHCMLFVGYGQEEVDGEMVDYWWVKNSWGDDWAENGFVKVKMGENVCGAEGNTAYVDVSVPNWVEPEVTTSEPEVTTADPNDYPERPEPTPDEMYEWFWKEEEVSDLENYVYTDEPGVFKWEEIAKLDSGPWDPANYPDIFKMDNFEAYHLNVTSQIWLNEEEISRPKWFHNVYVAVPKKFNPDYAGKAMVYIDGGYNKMTTESDPYPEMSYIFKVASDMGVVAMVIKDIPNQKLQFLKDHYRQEGDRGDWPNPPLPYNWTNPEPGTEPKSRGEDQLIAYTWWKFMTEGGDDQYAPWLLRFPMTKGVVKCMDAVTEWVEHKFNNTRTLENFMVAGASKRGWTTWTVGAVDKRVTAIAPLVMDALNLNQQMHSHYQNLGGWTFAFQDYWWENITTYIDTYEMGGLQKHVDPFSYRYKYARRNVNIYTVNSVGDEFFLVDDNLNYFDQMKQGAGFRDNQIFQRYNRNAEHSMLLHAVSNQHIVGSMEEFFAYSMRPQEFTLPNIHWNNQVEPLMARSGDQIGWRARLRIETDQEPEDASFFYARTQSKKRRDYRLVYVGCLERNETTGYRGDHVDCDCPEITKKAESADQDLKGICPQFLFWNQYRTLTNGNPLINLPNDPGTKFRKVRGKGDKYEFAYEAELDVLYENDFYRSGYIELKFPTILDLDNLIPEDFTLPTPTEDPVTDSPAPEELNFKFDSENGVFSISKKMLPDFDPKDLIDPRNNDRRGYGFVAHGQPIIIPEDRPGEDCTRESCFGVLL